MLLLIKYHVVVNDAIDVYSVMLNNVPYTLSKNISLQISMSRIFPFLF